MRTRCGMCILSAPEINEPVAATRNFLQASTRLDGDGSGRVANQTRSLQFCGRNGNSSPACSQRAGYTVLSKVKDAGAHAVFHHEKPAAQPLDEGVAVIADSQIRNFLQQTLKIGQRCSVKRVVLFEVSAQDSSLDAYCAARNLNNTRERGGIPEKNEYTSGYFMSHRPDFHASTATGVAEEGNHGGGWKIQILAAFARVDNRTISRQSDALDRACNLTKFSQRETVQDRIAFCP